MDAKGLPRKSRLRALAISILVIAAAVAIAAAVGRAYADRPATDDSVIDADIVHVAAAVGGRVVQLPVHENDLVRKGDLLFQIDPVPYRLALNQAAANLDVARATLDTQRRIVSTQRSNAAIAGEQARRAQTNYGLSQRTEERLQPLAEKGYVPQQQLDQAQVAVRDATTSIRQARSRNGPRDGPWTQWQAPRRPCGRPRRRWPMRSARSTTRRCSPRTTDASWA